MRSIEEIEALLEEALDGSARGRLVARGEARAIIRRNGVLPADAPQFSATIEADLGDHGFAILDAALELRSLDRSHALVRPAFQTAAKIMEALVRNGDPERTDRGFLRTVAGASYHLGSYAAVAFSLFPRSELPGLNVSPAEACLISLILRDFDSLLGISRRWLLNPDNSDLTMADQMQEGIATQSDVYAVAITSGMMRGLALYEFALKCEFR
ncbi:hypothetical protein [Martelella mediterranea]|uniref:Uncharacterized protein n=1 Tax=Martelella mediterranea DSM 17316 TaxID=1122214 RepID=A0A1U9Z401_9HYPH|nr:hypothetical protein [Martelella mediterranea]AQZ52433.1 hypothetical protein Mame_03118 [Martelella mediterranea DSM 17316]